MNVSKRPSTFGGHRIDEVGPKRDGNVVRINRNDGGSKKQEPKSDEDVQKTSGNSARTFPNWMITANQTRFAECAMASGFMFVESSCADRLSTVRAGKMKGSG